MKALPSAIWLDLLGKSWRRDARGPEAYDCVGVFLEIQHRLGVPVPDWPSRNQFLAAAKEQWVPVSDPQPGDGILITSDYLRWHLAVVCGEGYMIHADAMRGAVTRERYNSFPWQARIEGFYRWNRAKSSQS